MKKMLQQNIYVGCNVGIHKNVVNPDDIIRSFIILTGLENFSYTLIRGVFQGQPETTVQITVITDKENGIAVTSEQINKLRERFAQQCILTTVQELQGEFVYW